MASKPEDDGDGVAAPDRQPEPDDAEEALSAPADVGGDGMPEPEAAEPDAAASADEAELEATAPAEESEPAGDDEGALAEDQEEDDGPTQLLPYLSTRSWMMVGAVLFMVVLATMLTFFPAAPMITAFLFGVPSLILAVLILDRLEIDRWTMAIIVGGLLMYNSYLSYTGFGERNFDGGSQLEYIKYIVEHKALPSGDTCFICHHPPLYYILAALAFRFFEITKLAEPVRGIQIFSLVFIFSFLVHATLTVKRFTKSTRVIAVTTALITFWPYTIINSVRLHNDVLVSAFIGMGIFYLVRWYQEDRSRDMWLASALAVAAVLTKANGYILVAVIGVTVLERLLSRPGRLRMLKRVVPPLLAAAMAVGAYTTLRGPKENVDLRERVLGEAYKIHWRDFTTNEPGNYLYFDVQTFIKEPYVMCRIDGSGRQSFFTHLIKSSLFATHNTSPDSETSYRFNRRIAEVMNFMLLAMLALLLASVAMVKRGQLRRYFPLLASVFFLLAFHVAFKATIPSGHHNDFRFIYPLVVPLSFGYVLAAEGLSERRLAIAKLAWGLPLVFSVLSIFYYLPKFNLVKKYLPPHVLHMYERDINTVKAERTEWDKVGNTIILADELLEIEIPGARDVGSFEITVDNNDVYRLELYGLNETRTVDVGPREAELRREREARNQSKDSNAEPAAAETELTEIAGAEAPEEADAAKADKKDDKDKKFKGLVRYTRTLDPPVEKVRAVRIVPIAGDRSYSVGHVLFKAPSVQPASGKKRP